MVRDSVRAEDVTLAQPCSLLKTSDQFPIGTSLFQLCQDT